MLFTHDTGKSATQVVIALAELFGVKQSRMKENHAKALGFKSYNGLVSAIKSQPVTIDFPSYYSNLIKAVKEKHGTTLTWDSSDEAYGIIEEFCLVMKSDWSLYRINFQIIGVEGDFTGMWLEDVDTDAPYYLSDYLYELGLVNEVPYLQFMGTFSNCIDPDDFRSENILRGSEDTCFVLSTLSPSYEGGSANGYYTSGYGSLYIRSQTAINNLTEISTTDCFAVTDIYGRDVYLKLIDVKSATCPPNPYTDEQENLIGSVDSYEDSSHEILPLTFDASLEMAIKGNRGVLPQIYADGDYSQLDELMGSSISFDINVEQKTIQIECSRLLQYQYLGWGYMQELAFLPRRLTRIIEKSAEFKDYKLLYTYGGEAPSSTVLDDQIVVFHDTTMSILSRMGIDPQLLYEAGRSKEKLSAISARMLVDKRLNAINSLEELIQTLKSLGVTSIGVNELREWSTGDLVMNSFVGYNSANERVTFFEVVSVEGYCDHYQELKDYFNANLEVGLKVMNVYEDECECEFAKVGPYDHEEVLELPNAPESKKLGYMCLKLDILNPDLTQLLKMKTVPDTLLTDIFSYGGLPLDSFSITPPILIPDGQEHELIEAAIKHAHIKRIDNQRDMSRFTSTLRLFGAKAHEQTFPRRGLLMMVVFPDVADLLIKEYKAEMRLYNGALMPVPSANMNNIRHSLGCEGLRDIVYTDSYSSSESEDISSIMKSFDSLSRNK